MVPSSETPADNTRKRVWQYIEKEKKKPSGAPAQTINPVLLTAKEQPLLRFHPFIQVTLNVKLSISFSSGANVNRFNCRIIKKKCAYSADC